MRRRDDGLAVGTVQVTLLVRRDGSNALVAWVVGVPWQGHGYATEAATALVEWLHELGVDDIAAHIHPDHQASAAVASRAGLHRTADLVDGEVGVAASAQADDVRVSTTWATEREHTSSVVS